MKRTLVLFIPANPSQPQPGGAPRTVASALCDMSDLFNPSSPHDHDKA